MFTFDTLWLHLCLINDNNHAKDELDSCIAVTFNSVLAEERQTFRNMFTEVGATVLVCKYAGCHG